MDATSTWMEVCDEKGYWSTFETLPSTVKFEDHYTENQRVDAARETAKRLATACPDFSGDDLMVAVLTNWPDP